MCCEKSASRSILSTTKTYKITSSVFTLLWTESFRKSTDYSSNCENNINIALHYIYTIFPLIYFDLLKHIHRHPLELLIPKKLHKQLRLLTIRSNFLLILPNLSKPLFVTRRIKPQQSGKTSLEQITSAVHSDKWYLC